MRQQGEAYERCKEVVVRGGGGVVEVVVACGRCDTRLTDDPLAWVLGVFTMHKKQDVPSHTALATCFPAAPSTTQT